MRFRNGLCLLLFALAVGQAWGLEAAPAGRDELILDPKYHDFGEQAVGTETLAAFRVVNRGENRLISSVYLNGSADFAIAADGCVGRFLLSGGSCSVEVTFVPSGAGTRGAELVVRSWGGDDDDDDDGGATATADLSGTGKMQSPRIEVNPASLAFGEVTAGESSVRAVTVSNLGEGDLAVAGVAGGDSLTAPFSIVADNCSGTNLSPGNNCAVQVRFAPEGEGNFTDTFGIVSNDPQDPVRTISVSGAGSARPVPDIEVDRTVIDFGSVAIGAPEWPVETLAATNRGKADLTIGQIGGNNGLAAPFAIQADGCSGGRLPPGDRCYLQVSFAPGASGQFSDDFVIPSDDPDEPTVTIKTSGRGTAPAPLPELSLSPSSHDFGRISAGSSAEKAVTVSNVGGGWLKIDRVTGPYPDNTPFFLRSDNCSGKDLKSGQSCTFRVRFAPADGGFVQAEFRVSSSQGMKSVQVGGEGVSNSGSPPQPAIAVSSSDLLFGETVIGQTVDHQVEIRNTGSASLEIGRIGSPPAPFSLAEDACTGAVLAAGQACSCRITFAPAVAGTFAGSLDIPSNDPAQPILQVNLQGSATAGSNPGDGEGALPAGNIWVTDSVPPEDDLTVPFGTVPLGLGKRKTVYVTNQGEGDLQIGLIPGGAIDGQFAIVGPEENRFHCSERTLRPRQSCFIVVRFRPAAEENYTGELVIPSDDPDNGRAAVALTGSGGGATDQYPAPVQIEPDPGQDNLREDVTFRWYNCRDSEGKLASYRLYCSKDPDFGEFRLRVIGRAALGMFALGLGGAFLLPSGRRRRIMGAVWLFLLLCTGALMLSCSEDIEDSSTATLSNLEPQTTYHWKVVAEYEDGLEAESEVNTFTVR